jgi:hypothetical protein
MTILRARIEVGYTRVPYLGYTCVPYLLPLSLSATLRIPPPPPSASVFLSPLPPLLVPPSIYVTVCMCIHVCVRVCVQCVCVHVCACVRVSVSVIMIFANSHGQSGRQDLSRATQMAQHGATQMVQHQQGKRS